MRGYWQFAAKSAKQQRSVIDESTKLLNSHKTTMGLELKIIKNNKSRNANFVPKDSNEQSVSQPRTGNNSGYVSVSSSLSCGL